MNTENNGIILRNSILILVTLLVTFSRLINVMPNFSPLAAVSLFGAAHFKQKWQAFIIPLVSVWISDLFINNIIYSQYYSFFNKINMLLCFCFYLFLRRFLLAVRQLHINCFRRYLYT